MSRRSRARGSRARRWCRPSVACASARSARHAFKKASRRTIRWFKTNIRLITLNRSRKDLPMADEDSEDRLIIQGITTNNKKFRPSDWIERIATLWAQFGQDRRLRYSPALYPCVSEGVNSLVVAKGLQHQDPIMFDFVMQFARQNDLRVIECRRREPCPPAAEQRKEAWGGRRGGEAAGGARPRGARPGKKDRGKRL